MAWQETGHWPLSKGERDMKAKLIWLLAALLLIPPTMLAAEGAEGGGAPPGSWLAAVEKMTAEAEVEAKEKAAVPKGDGPPLPLHTMEGVGGALAVPMAYLVNPGPEGTTIGKPAFSMTFLHLGTKNVQVFAITETLFRRIELGYAFSRFDLGNLGHVVRKATGGLYRIRRREVYLHHFNARALVLPENSFGLPLPAVCAGIQAKLNGGIMGINDSLYHPVASPFLFRGQKSLTYIGLERSNGIDYVITASKMIPRILFGRPLILTCGVRNSQASNFGYTGFGDSCHTTIEFDVTTLLTDRLAVGYEFRQRTDPYDRFPPVHKGEDNLHAIRAAYVVNDHFVIAVGWASLGHVGNMLANCAWGIQLKYEF